MATALTAAEVAAQTGPAESSPTTRLSEMGSADDHQIMVSATGLSELLRAQHLLEVRVGYDNGWWDVEIPQFQFAMGSDDLPKVTQAAMSRARNWADEQDGTGAPNLVLWAVRCSDDAALAAWFGLPAS